jgi:acyl carrier protein
MVPNMYMRLKEFPYTPTGKLYRKGLPVPDVDVNDDYVAPESDIEQKLVEIWADVLAVKQDVISCEKSFFELGGNSFKAIVMGNRIQMEFNKGIPLRAFLQKPTVKEIALLIQSPVGNDSSESQMEYVF